MKHVRPRARDFCKMVGKVEKLPWKSITFVLLTTLRQLGGGPCERGVRSTFTQVAIWFKAKHSPGTGELGNTEIEKEGKKKRARGRDGET